MDIYQAMDLPVHGQPDRRNQRRERLQLQPTRMDMGETFIVVDAAIFQQIRDLVGDNGLDLSPQGALEFARQLQEFVHTAIQVVEMCNRGRGLQIHADKRNWEL